jgi:hypothetical protein
MAAAEIVGRARARPEDSRGLSIGARLALATVGVLSVVSVLLFSELTRRERQALV